MPDVSASSAVERPSVWTRVRHSFWFNLLVAFVVLGLVQAFLVKLYFVPSGSMQATLEIGDRIAVDRIGEAFSDPRRGDIEVFTASDSWHPIAPHDDDPLKAALRWVSELTGVGPGNGGTLVKRVIGLPGDTVECCDATGHVTVDGDPLDEPYVHQDLPFTPDEIDCASVTVSPRCFGPVEVPAGMYLMLGDNRANSADSVIECRGITAPCDAAFMARDDAVGRAFSIVWPIGRWAGL